ncbi:MAG: hypothetical protein ACYCXU_03385 [Thermoleophilia bacterium]
MAATQLAVSDLDPGVAAGYFQFLDEWQAAASPVVSRRPHVAVGVAVVMAMGMILSRHASSPSVLILSRIFRSRAWIFSGRPFAVRPQIHFTHSAGIDT